MAGTLHLILLGALLSQPLLRNNGDYYRVLLGAIDLPAWSPAPECLALNRSWKIPGSSLGAVFMVLANLGHWVGLQCWPPQALPVVLWLMLAAGSFLAIRESRDNAVPVIAVVGLSLVFSFLWASFYEEAAVLPSIPWVLFGASRLTRRGQSWPLVVAACFFLFSKAQLVLFLPLLAFLVVRGARHFGTSPWRTAGSLLLLTMAVVSPHGVKRENSQPNAYNRFYNGLGWAVQGVGTWPAHDFMQRLGHFQANRVALQQSSARLETTSGERLMGTSYWPTGRAILQDGEPSARQAEVGRSIGFRRYAQALSDRAVLPDFLLNAGLVVVRSDYSLGYLRAADESRPQPRAEGLTGFALKHAGWLYLAGVLAACGACRSATGRWVLLHVLAWPLVVVVGDGFYEFEKHLTVFFLSAPVLFCCRLGAKPDGAHARPLM